MSDKWELVKIWYCIIIIIYYCIKDSISFSSLWLNWNWFDIDCHGNFDSCIFITKYYRLKRDIAERQRDLVGVLQQYNKFVKPVSVLKFNLFRHDCKSVIEYKLPLFFQAFDQYIAPTVVYADIVVPRGGENSVAIDLIIRHVRNQLEQVGENRFYYFYFDFF